MNIVDSILNHIKPEQLTLLGQKYFVDKNNTKISGSLMLKGLMLLVLNGQQASLRLLSIIIERRFKTEVTYSGLSKRLKVLDYRYFQDIYEDLVTKIIPQFQQSESPNLHIFDSTAITLIGYVIQDRLDMGGNKKDSCIKVTVSLKNKIPASVRFCSNQNNNEETSENTALIRAINDSKADKEDILLFDQGITKSMHYVDLKKQGHKFVTRVWSHRRHILVEKNTIKESVYTNGTIIADNTIYLLNRHETPIREKLRLITLQKEDGKKICFLTNLFDLTPQEIADLYRRRWDIEVFFKFIKQSLGYKHFLSHSSNGIKSYIYIILITAVLFMLYKKKTGMTGFKIALFQFNFEINDSIIKDLILLSSLKTKDQSVIKKKDGPKEFL